MILLTAVVVGYMLLSRAWQKAFFTTAAIALGAVLSHVLKLQFDRPRPDVVPHLVEVVTASFPSAHAAVAAATYLTLAALVAKESKCKRLKAFALLMGLFLAFLVGMTRILLGVHYPTDVLAGWGFGVFWALLCWIVAESTEIWKGPSSVPQSDRREVDCEQCEPA